MNRPPPPSEEHLPKQEVFKLSVEDLEDRFKRLYTALHQTVTAITRHAQAAEPSQPPSTPVTELEERFNAFWQALEPTVDAISLSATFAHHNARQFEKLADVAGEGMFFLQAVTSGQDITAEWFARRDGIVAQARKLIDDDRLFPQNTEGGTTPP